MKQVCLFIILLLVGRVNAQEVNRVSAIEKEFSAPAINAYQERSQDKVQEFYAYLELLTDPKNPVELKQQIEANIYNLFQSETVSVVDFTSPEKTPISLQKLLKRLQSSPKARFSLSEKTSTRVLDDYWFERYTLTVSSAEETRTFQLRQKIQFTKKTKTFGSQKKKVWELQLSSVQ